MGKYEVILADPPWDFKTYSDKGKGRSAEKHYKTLTLEDIKKLPVHKLAARDCVLFLWSVGPRLDDAFDVIREWGFGYKTKAFCWAKETKLQRGWHFGMGYWTRANSEDCLLATRGHPKRVDASVPQLVVSPVLRHSAKPPGVRDRIVKLVGDVPRIELFAREAAPGWDATGLEYDGMDIREFLSK